MLASEQQKGKTKQRKIRYSEYYDMESVFDRLYAYSKAGKMFNHLMNRSFRTTPTVFALDGAAIQHCPKSSTNLSALNGL